MAVYFCMRFFFVHILVNTFSQNIYFHKVVHITSPLISAINSVIHIIHNQQKCYPHNIPLYGTQDIGNHQVILDLQTAY